jgi:hypothetical protein
MNNDFEKGKTMNRRPVVCFRLIGHSTMSVGVVWHVPERGHRTRDAHGDTPTINPRAVRFAPQAAARCGPPIGQGHKDGRTMERQADEGRRELTDGSDIRGGIRRGRRLGASLGAA